MPAPSSGEAPHPTIPKQRPAAEPPTAGRRCTHPPDTGRSKTDLAIEAAIGALIAKAPPLSGESRARLAELLSAGTQSPARGGSARPVRRPAT
jgi:hypothetical protein